MEKSVKIFLFGKEYWVPENLTVMTAMEYVGYRLVRGCGCRNGFCGACATFYRVNDGTTQVCLACQTRVQDNMHIAVMPSFPIEKRIYDIEKISPAESVMLQLYPELHNCIGCNICTKNCPQGLNVKGYVSKAKNADFKGCAEESFECVMCGACASKCPARIPQSQVAMTARRINGKYLSPTCEHLEKRVNEIKNGEFNELIEALMQKPIEEIKELYNNREIK